LRLISFLGTNLGFSNFQDVTDAESQLAAGIIALQEPFCQYLQSLISRLLGNTQSHSAKVKSRAMTSLTQMIEKDPQILDDKSFPGLARLIGDNSPMVRENTVSLISKCLEQDPSLERHCLQGILNLMTDPANGPKKKAIKLLKEIYITTLERDKKVRIATELLLPVLDDDKAIAELTRQTFEDIWLAPLRSTSKLDENQLKLDRENRVSLLIFTVQNIQARPAHLQAFETFFTTVLSATAKNAMENFKI
jgi:cohesin loading factor subunit SCC2